MSADDVKAAIENAPLHEAASQPKSRYGLQKLPATEPLDGATVLERVRAALTRYVVLPSPEAADAITCWIVATHAQHAWEHATRLIIKSPLKRCGKTRLLEVISELVHLPLRTVNISSAALVRSIDKANPPTIILDEGDTIFAKRRGEASEQAEAIRGILNSGHSRNWPYIRWNAAAREREECETFAMAVIAAIGDLPETIEDRGAVIGMRRRMAGEHVAQFRRRRAVPELHKIRDRVERWVGSVDLKNAEPELPVEDRAADCWESLIAVADAAGGSWPERARAACIALTTGSEADADEGGAGERLLGDLYAIWHPVDEHGEPHNVIPPERFSTADLLRELKEIDEAPWADWAGGKGLSGRGLAELLRPFRVKVRKWSGGTRGYFRADLVDPWTRYRHPSAPSAQAPHERHYLPVSIEESPVADTGSPSATATATGDSPPKLTDRELVAGVADWADIRLERVTEETF